MQQVLPACCYHYGGSTGGKGKGSGFTRATRGACDNDGLTPEGIAFLFVGEEAHTLCFIKSAPSVK
jgi:hypothetical protein